MKAQNSMFINLIFSQGLTLSQALTNTFLLRFQSLFYWMSVLKSIAGNICEYIIFNCFK